MRRIPFGYITKATLTKTWHRLSSELGGPVRALRLRSGQVGVFNNISLSRIYGEKAPGAALLSGQFNYAGQVLDIGRQGDPWSIPAPSERFAYWLHSFEWLEDLVAIDDAAATVRARILVDRWINVYGQWNPYAWDSDILANRLFAWLSVWSKSLAIDKFSDTAQLRRNAVMRQLKQLKAEFRRLPPGISQIKGAAALALGGLYSEGKSGRFLDQGLDLLNDVLEEQILIDGGHISRAPEKALESLHILSILSEALEVRNVTKSKILFRAKERLQHVVPFFRMPDKGLSVFNGGSEGKASWLKALVDRGNFKAKPFVYCPQTGYQRIEQNGTVMLVDTGQTTPRPYDLEAHIGPLAFELSSPAGRLIVNCGWSEEQPNTWRQMMRSTAAHSTLTLNNRSAGQIVDQGFKSKILGRAIEQGIDDTKAMRKDQASGVWLEMSHNGYLSEMGLSHRRRLYVKNDGRDIRGEDGLLVPIGEAPLSREQIPFDIRFHLHPSVRATLAQDMQSALLIQPGHVGWRFRTDGGPMRIEDSVYLGQGDSPMRSQQIVISGQAFGDSDGETKSNRVRWSLRRLEARKS